MVSFTKNAESNPKPTTNAINIKDGLCLAFSNIFIDTSLSTPDLSSAETILNMPKRNPITSRLIYLNQLYDVYIYLYKSFVTTSVLLVNITYPILLLTVD